MITRILNRRSIFKTIKFLYSSNSKMWFLNVKMTLTNAGIEGTFLKLIKKTKKYIHLTSYLFIF